MGLYKLGTWTAPGPSRNPALFIETPQGMWKAMVHEDDSTWYVRGPDPDNPEHYADGEVSTSDPDVRVGDMKGRAAAAKKRARAYIMAQIKKASGSKASDLKHWKVKFTRRGMEPPRPFGKTSAVVCAASRKEALEMVPASPGYPITASITEEPVSFTFRCRHEAHGGDVSSAPKTKRELDADIAEVLDKPYPP